MVNPNFESLLILLLVCAIIQVTTSQIMHWHRHELAPQTHEGKYGQLQRCITLLKGKCGKEISDYISKKSQRTKMSKDCRDQLVKECNNLPIDTPFNKDIFVTHGGFVTPTIGRHSS